MLTFDVDILLWINGHGNEWLDTIMWTISRANTWIPLYALLVGLIAWRYRNWKTILLILLGFGVVAGLSDFTCSGIIKPLVARLRPTHEPSIDPIRLVHAYVGGRFGFCSSHAANTMACALLFSLIYRHKIATTAMMVWVALNCYSRMYLGVHYPTDIMVGLMVGAVFAGSCYWALRPVLHADDEVAQQGGS